MPVYEYACGACGRSFEVTRKFSDPALTVCQFCASPQIRKVLAAPAFVLKGSGWYATDYASGDRKKALDAEKSSPSPAAKPAGEATAGSGCASGACSGACPSSKS